MGMKTPCLGAHSGPLKKTLVARTHNLGAPGARAPVRQQPWLALQIIFLKQRAEKLSDMCFSEVKIEVVSFRCMNDFYNTKLHESRFSESTQRIEAKEHFFLKAFQSTGQLKYLFFVRYSFLSKKFSCNFL